MIKKIWKDPVGSKIISVIIIGVGSSLWSIISAMINKINFTDAWVDFWNLQLKLWWVAIILIVYIIVEFIRTKQTKKDFLNYTQGEWSGTKWEWSWLYDRETNKYKISNLHMLCPQCKTGVFNVATMYSQNYECISCGYSIPVQAMSNKPYSSQVEKEIQTEATRKFPTEVKHIEFKNK